MRSPILPALLAVMPISIDRPLSASQDADPADLLVTVETGVGFELRTDARGHRVLAIDQRATSSNASRKAGAAGTTVMLEPSWSPIGPFGGDVEDVAGSPVDPGLVLAGIAPGGSVGGTLYRSTDGGATWDEESSLSGTSVHDIELAPDGTVYIGGGGQTQVPFGNGLRCVSAGSASLFRLPVQNSGPTGRTSFVLDYGALLPAGAITAGSVWSFQHGFRDPDAGAASSTSPTP